MDKTENAKQIFDVVGPFSKYQDIQLESEC